MRAGLLRFPIVILEEAKTKDSFGATKKTWVEFTRTKSNITYKTGDKKVEDNKFINSQNIDFTIRHNIKVDEQMRIQYDGKLYKVQFINRNIINNSQIVTCDFIEKA